MRITKMFAVLCGGVLSAAMVLPAFAQDGGATSRPNAPDADGTEGQGKVGPALKGTSLSAEQMADLLTKGDDAKKAPHKKALSGLSADDAKAVAEFVKTLKSFDRQPLHCAPRGISFTPSSICEARPDSASVVASSPLQT